MSRDEHVPLDRDPGRPFEALRDSSLLWLINRVVFHPRGYALAFHYADGGDGSGEGEATGWSLVGDGTEPWKFSGDVDEDAHFARVEETLRGDGR